MKKKKKKRRGRQCLPNKSKEKWRRGRQCPRKEKKNRQAMSKRKKKSVNFCPKMMPNFSLQFSLHFGEKTFCGSWEKMLVKYGLHLIQNRRSGKLMDLFHSQLITCVTTPPHLCRYCPLWGPYPSWFCSSSGCAGEKASTHWREIIPYKHILMCFPRRCGIPWNARPPFLGHYNPPPLRAHASSRVGPTLPARAWLWYHL